AAGDFFRGVQKQRPGQYQGLYLVAPGGEVLARHQNFKSHKTWSEELLADLEPGLNAYGTDELRDAKRTDAPPLRGPGAQPEATKDGVAQLLYEGTLAGSHLTQAKKRTHGEAKMTGAGRLDVKTGQLLSVVWVCAGIYKGPPPYDQPHSYSAVVEWTRAKPQ